jgi:hypothetical protein
VIRFYTWFVLWKQGHIRNIHSEWIQKIEHYRDESLHDIQLDYSRRIVCETPTCQLFYWYGYYLWKTQGVFAMCQNLYDWWPTQYPNIVLHILKKNLGNLVKIWC